MSAGGDMSEEPCLQEKMEAVGWFRLTAVNPYCEWLGYATADCWSYNSNRLVRYAFSFKHVLMI